MLLLKFQLSSSTRSETGKLAHKRISLFLTSSLSLPSFSPGMKHFPETRRLLHQPQTPLLHIDGADIPARSIATRTGSSEEAFML